MNTAANRGDWVGLVIDGRLTLLQWLGGSARSDVFLTELPGHPPQKAAIKLIPADGADAEARMAGWALARNLPHPHLMRLLDTGHCRIDGATLLYAVTELADEVLAGILPERALTPDETKEMLDPVLNALGYLHGKGLVHGHLKPSNILVVDNQLKLSGDGLCAAGERGSEATAPSVYDAPEVAAGTISPAADIWSLGVTIVEALTQHPPLWRSPTHRELVVPESIPEPFAGIARRCLQHDPARRCTVADVKARLAPAQPLPAAPGTTQPLPDTAREPRKAVPAKLRGTVMIVAVLALLGFIVALQMRSHKSQASLPAASPPQASGPVTEPPRGVRMEGAVAQRVLPDVLPSARESIRGTVAVEIRVSVDPKGNVSDATFESAGPSRYFGRVALEAARQWRFKPAQVGGQAIASVWVLRFEFRQTGTDVTPVDVSH